MAHPLPNLKVPRTEAESQLKDRIKQLRDIKKSTLKNREEIALVETQYKKWSEYTGTLLLKIFDSDRYHYQYVMDFGTWYFDFSDPSSSFKEFSDGIESRIGFLESVIEQLSLLDEIRSMPQNQDLRKTTSNRIFIVHGHDDGLKQEVARFLEKLDLKPIILHEQPDQGKTIIEKFERFSDVSFAVVLLTEDDIGYAKDHPEKAKPRGRQNVILELGFFIGKLGRDKVCSIYKGGVELPTDYSGVLYKPYDSAGAWKVGLATEIKASGLNVDMNKII